MHAARYPDVRVPADFAAAPRVDFVPRRLPVLRLVNAGRPRLPHHVEPMTPSRRERLRQIVPLVGTALLIGLLAYTTDIAKFRQALAHADLTRYGIVLVLGAIFAWLYDSFCVTWLIGQTLHDRGEPFRWRTMLPIKAASYAINAINYPLAALAISWLVSRRKKVPFLEATGALALLSYLDLLALGGLVAAGLLLAPEVVASQPSLQVPVQVATVLILVGGAVGVAVIQSELPVPLLQRLRRAQVLKPLVSIAPQKLLIGVLLRTGLVASYALINFLMMQSFGMEPQWGRLLVIMPLLTVIGTIPASVSGIGTTQVPMRAFYAPFVQDGRDPAPVIDAFSTAMIIGFVVVRLVLALPFLRGVLRELRERPQD